MALLSRAPYNKSFEEIGRMTAHQVENLFNNEYLRERDEEAARAATSRLPPAGGSSSPRGLG